MSFDKIKLAQNVARVLPTEWATLAAELVKNESLSDAIDSLAVELRHRYLWSADQQLGSVESYLYTEIMYAVDWQRVAKILISKLTDK